ncbi:hypothetical protein B0H12DRAFT_1246410 [Mycena haematopus]|nr:hypothetical protein B0H12DRAFT_1246410 [Mycena haematopus]
MAPPAKERALPAGFLPSEDGKKIRCNACTAISPTRKEVWIARNSLSNHEKSAGHLRALQSERIARTRAAELERNRNEDLAQRRQTEMRFSGLRDVQIPEDRCTSRIQSAAETELWDELETDHHAAGFDLGTDKTTQQYRDLCSEMNNLWNAGMMSGQIAQP